MPRDTFIELFVEVVNKLKHKNKDIDAIFDDLPKSDEVIIEVYLNTLHK